jgi:hypothetical protein
MARQYKYCKVISAAELRDEIDPRVRCCVCNERIYSSDPKIKKSKRPCHPSCAPQLLVDEWNREVEAKRLEEKRIKNALRDKYGPCSPGKKRCPECGSESAYRTKTCKCGHKFYE